MKETIVVTGGLGFIGGHLVDRLVAEGHRVFVLDNASPKKGYVNAGATYVQLDVWSDEKRVRKLMAKEKPSVLFHLAANKDLRSSVKMPMRDAQVNVIGTLNLLEAMRDAGGGRFVFASTAAVYPSEAKCPISETAKTRPETPYGISKRAAEMYLWHFSSMYPIAGISLRFANVYGPRCSPSLRSAVNIFAEHALKKEEITMNGSGEQMRDFIYIDDVVDALMRAMNTAWCGEMNIGTGEETSLNELCRLIGAHVEEPLSCVYGEAKDGDVFRNSLSPELARSVMGWQAQTSIQEGVRKLMEWYKEHGVA